MPRPAVAALALLSCVALSAGCSDSGGSFGGFGGPGSAGATAAAGGGGAGSVASGGGPGVAVQSAAPDTNAACADVRSIISINAEFDAAGDDLAKGQLLVVQLVSAAGRFAAHAPADLRDDAVTYLKAVTTLGTAAARAHSIQDLHSASASDPELKAALADLHTTGDRIVSWKDAHC